MMKQKAKPRLQGSTRDAWEYQLIFLVSYPIFLLGEILGRLRGTSRALPSSQTQSRQRLSIFGAARQSAHMALPYAF